MQLSEMLLLEFDQEMANTRKSLERLPEEKMDWQPHPQSMTKKQLAVHLAEIPAWTPGIIQQDSRDIAPPGGTPYQHPQANSRKEVLDLFDNHVAAARATIAGSSDENFAKPWTFLSGGKTIFTLPRIAVLRSFIFNHSVHHRAQFGVYLRLNNVPVPAIYGPSADETGM